jgi:lipoic acid synthetase
MSMTQRFPDWLKKRLPSGPEAAQTRRLVAELRLATVCHSAKCPNIWECYARHVATFMILGDRCTRGCRFCGVARGEAGPPDPDEPRRVAEAVGRLGLRHAVITSVTRDDLPDGGAAHFVATIKAVRAANPAVTVEVLTPDFQDDCEAIRRVVEAGPDVFNHNVETVPRLYPAVRPGADYARSLDVLHTAKALRADMLTKSGLMVGLGEEPGEVEAVLGDLRQAGVDLVTIGQYLQPTREHLPVAEFVRPDVFARYEANATEQGFAAAFCGPFVRSSYKAGETLVRLRRTDAPQPTTCRQTG